MLFTANRVYMLILAPEQNNVFHIRIQEQFILQYFPAYKYNEFQQQATCGETFNLIFTLSILSGRFDIWLDDPNVYGSLTLCRKHKDLKSELLSHQTTMTYLFFNSSRFHSQARSLSSLYNKNQGYFKL